MTHGKLVIFLTKYVSVEIEIENYLTVRTSSSNRMPSILINASPYLGLLFIASQSLIRRAKTLQFCCPTVMLLSFLVDSIAEIF
jgi:hypothetical protein